MADIEGDAGSLSEVGEIDGEWGFTLYDVHGDELLFFAFHTERDARVAHKMMSHVVMDAMAIAPTREPTGFVAIPKLKSRSAGGS